MTGSLSKTGLGAEAPPSLAIYLLIVRFSALSPVPKLLQITKPGHSPIDAFADMLDMHDKGLLANLPAGIMSPALALGGDNFKRLCGGYSLTRTTVLVDLESDIKTVSSSDIPSLQQRCVALCMYMIARLASLQSGLKVHGTCWLVLCWYFC